ncbi:LAFE_0E08174g1_1 [Lachancea fermentati]|uniref:LAFE_0E08174g1_1 n=1 Tax=Lachancea fermentati TaxID=4955 RepID=A0A1G4MD92_LACFM|nr:LAFE_0E08174g1_1 [Lachancea fermentati]
MRINVTLPLKWAQWWVYILSIAMVNLVIILPLSGLLFHDFYTRLIPPDTVQKIPFSIGSKTSQLVDGNTIFRFRLKRLSSETAILPQVIDNGLTQDVSLRSDIPYNFDLKLNIFCLNTSPGLNIKEGTITVSASSKKNWMDSVIFQKTVLLSCANTNDIIALGEAGSLSSTFSQRVQKELVNSFFWEDYVLDHDVQNVVVSLKFAEGSYFIVDAESSELKFSMNLNHSLRNLMLRWKKLTHVVGILVFNLVVLFFFVVGFLISFMRVGNVPQAAKKSA